MTESVRALREAAAQTLASLDPATISARDAKAMVEDFAELGRLATAGQLLLAPKVAETGLWRQKGDRSPAEWLAREAHVPVTEARSVLSTGKQLAGLPVAEAAVRAGKLSLPQAREVTDTATLVPHSEEQLVRMAERDSLQALRDKATRLRAAHLDDAGRQAKIRRERCLHLKTDGEGAFCLTARGPADDGARLLAALHPYQQARFLAGRKTGVHDGAAAEAWDALVDLATGRRPTPPDAATPTDSPARRTTDSPAPGTDVAPVPVLAGGVGSPNRARRSGTPAAAAGPTAAAASRSMFDPTDEPDHAPAGAVPPPGPGDRLRPTGHKIIFRIDLAAYRRGHTQDGELCDLTGIGPVPVAVVRELLDDAFIAAVITDGLDVRKVHHLGRQPTAAQRTALQLEQPTCTVEGCTRTIGLETDHELDYAISGHTVLDELERKCGHHHDLHTHHRWKLIAGTGRRPIVPPDDPRHPDHPSNAPPTPDTS